MTFPSMVSDYIIFFFYQKPLLVILVCINLHTTAIPHAHILALEKFAKYKNYTD